MWQMRIMKQSCLSHRAAGRIFCVARHTEVKVYAVPIFVKPLKEAEGLPVEGMEVKPGKYRHFKGKCYSVLYVATHSETLERYVVYRQLYGNEEVWIRPLAMFCESILVDGVLTPRFTYIGK